MRKRDVQTWTLLAPWIITLIVFWIYPLVYALVLSFSKYKTLTNEISFVGVENYQRAFNDVGFWQALKNTTVFTVGTVPVTTAFAILLAWAVRRRTPALASFFRASYFLPSVTSLVVIALVFTNLYSRDGYINGLCGMMGIPFPEGGWLLDKSTALGAIMAMDVWISTGYYMVLFLAGMEAIPRDLYEAAELAGASSWQQFWRITLPMLRSTLLFVVVINSIKSFQIFVEIYVMTKGGPLGATSTLVYEVYTQAFEQSDMMGYASAVAYIVFVILLCVSFLQMRLLRVRP
ncbi:MAG: sugar ABC transporter permease [Candidatus Kapabacteria bacterium]|nr:sugar ABC transporter permease [Candidatus Kapabacteria bacterium]